jgi:transcriptional regulator with XRE-family HTH domain
MPPQALSIGDNLRHARLAQELSLAEVAGKVGISVATLSRVETDKQGIDVALLLKLAGVLGIPAAEILGGQSGGGEDTDSLARRLARLRPADRKKVILASARRPDRKQLATVMDDMLSTVDVLREELLQVQRAVRRRGTR